MKPKTRTGTMMAPKVDVKSVTEYIALQPAAMQTVLKRVRSAIRRAIPEAEEMISYQIPTYKLNGRAVIYFAGWKQHYSIYPSTAGVVAAFKDDLAQYEVAKGTIRFPFSKPAPVSLIEGIARVRAGEATARAKAKQTPPKRRSRRHSTGDGS